MALTPEQFAILNVNDRNDQSFKLDSNNEVARRVCGDINVVLDNNLIDANNSTTTPLGISGSFVGVGTDVSNYNAISIILHADQDSSVDGMCFEFSTDNVNWDDPYCFNLDITQNQTRRFQFPTVAQYFRVNYTNGTSAQGVFRVQTILHKTNILTSIHRIDQSLANDRSVTVVKSVITGETTAGGGGFVNVKVDPSGSLETNANQDTHDDLNANANLQVGDVDVSNLNPVPVTSQDTDTTTSIFNIPLGLANTEQSQALPANTKEFLIKSRGNSELKLAYAIGQSNSTFITVPKHGVYTDNNFYSAQTLYFQSPQSGDTIEIVAFV